MTCAVLIVEDELFVALDLEDTVEALGYSIAGTCGTLAGTLAAIERQLPTCAILDVRLPDGEVFPAADVLRDAGVPLIFHSGHADENQLKTRYPEAQVYSKPCSPSRLREALLRAAA
ncbi:MAG: response regulator [Novosphingobium sp.]|nr:response regulator [Novosphingobium sp.]